MLILSTETVWSRTNPNLNLTGYPSANHGTSCVTVFINRERNKTGLQMISLYLTWILNYDDCEDFGETYFTIYGSNEIYLIRNNYYLIIKILYKNSFPILTSWMNFL